jgi:DNA-binding transcriptional MerR regulator
LLLKGIRHLLYDQGFTIKGVQKILKDQGARHVAGIGNGGIGDMLPPANVDEQMTGAIELANGDDHAVPVNGAKSRSLAHSDHEKLNGVLRDLLECKRLLERARE